ncbi:layilin isoform X2 [Cynoglossus semilaevis]|uniref:Layilin b n=2 Tax=Cynoglossus semilaevis TaxID=244447 RepID=A0A3P8WMS6_CYNSE|nr:layilin-like isoform X2 [Cynoglossus semilaevis]
MDLMQLFATVVAVLFHPGSKTNGQMICRRGRERPCYKVSHIVQDGRRRPTFEDARQSCGLDGGQLLSIETESEQRLIERFIQQLQAGDADYWIVLRHGPQHNTAVTTSPGCPSHYYWLDGSKAKIRNWHWNKPSCDGEKCVVLYDWPSALPDEGAGFKWNNDDCNSKNSVVCKYPEEKVPVFTDERNMTHAAPSVRPSLLSTTESTEKTGKVQPESSDDSLHLSYILYGTIPAVLLLLFAAVGFFCYRHHGKRRKTETGSYSSRTPPWMSTASTPCPIQGPYAFSDITKLPPTVPHSATDNRTKIFCAPLHDSQCDEYENVVCTNREIGFVTNDIYETCRSQNSQTGWVDNEIYA